MSFDFGAIFRATAANLTNVPDAYTASVSAATQLLAAALQADRKLLTFGNGGSSTDAQHIAAELVGRFQRTRKALPAIALTANQAILTAWANDHSFDDVFARQVEALGRPGDVAWGISTSGKSPNVVNALKRARELGLKTIGLTGDGGGRMAEHCDVVMAIPLTDTPRIQEVHLVTCHAICAALEDVLFPEA
jgi:D-sedoheptulose 7-phosphate isomerase